MKGVANFKRSKKNGGGDREAVKNKKEEEKEIKEGGVKGAARKELK